MDDILFKSEDHIFAVGVAGILVKDGKLLVQRDRGGNEYALPGGHIKFGETTADGLVREYKEETGADIRPIRLLWTEECFWEWNGRKAHSLVYYYLIELCNGSDIPYGGEFVSQKDNCDVLLGWMPIVGLKDVVIYPKFLKKKIFETDAPFEHFITKEMSGAL